MLEAHLHAGRRDAPQRLGSVQPLEFRPGGRTQPGGPNERQHHRLQGEASCRLAVTGRKVREELWELFPGKSTTVLLPPRRFWSASEVLGRIPPGPAGRDGITKYLPNNLHLAFRELDRSAFLDLAKRLQDIGRFDLRDRPMPQLREYVCLEAAHEPVGVGREPARAVWSRTTPLLSAPESVWPQLQLPACRRVVFHWGPYLPPGDASPLHDELARRRALQRDRCQAPMSSASRRIDRRGAGSENCQD